MAFPTTWYSDTVYSDDVYVCMRLENIFPGFDNKRGEVLKFIKKGRFEVK